MPTSFKRSTLKKAVTVCSGGISSSPKGTAKQQNAEDRLAENRQDEGLDDNDQAEFLHDQRAAGVANEPGRRAQNDPDSAAPFRRDRRVGKLRALSPCEIGRDRQNQETVIEAVRFVPGPRHGQ